VLLDGAEDRCPGEFAFSGCARLCEGPDVVAVHKLHAGRSESSQVAGPGRVAGVGSIDPGNKIMGASRPMFSFSTVTAWLSAMPRATLAVELAVIGAAT